LENDGFVVQVVEVTAAIHDVLIGAGDETLFHAGVSSQHRECVMRHEHHAAEQAGSGAFENMAWRLAVLTSGQPQK
jgi:hypothetical protein